MVQMRIDVALLPSLVAQPVRDVCIIVDVLRASTSCVTMLDRGAASIAVAASVETARTLRQELMPDALLCGESGGLPPESFDYGNSPVEFATLEFAGRRVVLATSNGTRALALVAEAPAVLVGCLLNRSAISAAAVGAALRADAGVTVVCAGNDYGRLVSLDDTLTAGAIVNDLMAVLGDGGLQLDPTDAAVIARDLFEVRRQNLAGSLQSGVHGRALARLGFGADLALCARLDQSSTVPRLQRRPDGALVLISEDKT
jgi:2-phosphosulfolactate phosphatase